MILTRFRVKMYYPPPPGLKEKHEAKYVLCAVFSDLVIIIILKAIILKTFCNMNEMKIYLY